MGRSTSKTERTSYTPQETRLILSIYNARQMDAALPTTVDTPSTQTYDASVTCQPAESAPRALSNGQKTIPQSMDTDPDNLGVIVTPRSAPSPLPGVSAFADEQAGIESWEGYQLDELESTSYTPREVRETRQIILSANDACQTDVASTTSDLPSPQQFEAAAARQPTLAPLLLPRTHRPAIQKEEDLIQLEQEIIHVSATNSFSLNAQSLTFLQPPPPVAFSEVPLFPQPPLR